MNSMYMVPIILMLLVSSGVAGAVTGDRVVFIVFGSERCPHCKPMYEWLAETYGGDSVVFCELGNNRCSELFSKLTSLGVPSYIPATVVVNGSVRAIVIGEYRDKPLFDELLSLHVPDRVPVYTGPELAGYIDKRGCTLVIEELVSVLYPSSTSNDTSIGGRTGAWYLVYTVSLAAVDSVNPCVFLLLFALLVTVFMVGGRRLAVYSAIVFTSAVFVSYMGMGLGLYKIMYFIPRWAMPVLAIVFGVLMLTDVMGKTMVSRVLGKTFPGCPACKLYDDMVRSRIEKASSPIVWAGLLGLFSSFTLLPCTAGPYILFTRLIAELPIYEAISYLLLYNIVFISPLAVITVGGLCLTKISRFAEVLNRYEKVIRTMGGVLVIILGIYMFINF